VSGDGFVRVGTLAEVPEGEARAFECPWGRVAVAHLEQRLYAFEDECPNAGCSLAEGSIDDRTAQVTCVCHESVFDLETGEPLAGPARDPLALYRVREADGWVELAPGRPG
jgi:3-phenylpropionate/trans-cinnamate dioxygenase ferredoxin subunit